MDRAVETEELSNVVVYLVGFASTGKLTIARELAPMLNAKVVDNHWVNNPIFGLLETDGKTKLPDAVWDRVGEAGARSMTRSPPCRRPTGVSSSPMQVAKAMLSILRFTPRSLTSPSDGRRCSYPSRRLARKRN